MRDSPPHIFREISPLPASLKATDETPRNNRPRIVVLEYRFDEESCRARVEYIGVELCELNLSVEYSLVPSIS